MTRLKRSQIGREVQRDQINQMDQNDLMDQMSQMDQENRINQGQTGQGRIYQAMVSSAQMDPAQVSRDVRRGTICTSASTNCCTRCPPSSFKNLLHTASLLAGRFL